MENNIPATLAALTGAFKRGLPVNKPVGLSEHESKQWWKLVTVVRDQTGIDYTVDQSSGSPVVRPVR